MAYHLDFTDNALKDIDFHKKSGNKVILKKLLILLEELAALSIYRNRKARAFKNIIWRECGRGE